MTLQPHFFNRSDGCKLFGLHFPAQRPRKDFALVFCNAFGKEYEISRTQVSRFGFALATRGVGAYRFDYFGYGDSEGLFEDTSFSMMCDDLEAAIEEAKRRCGVEKVVLAGLRFGGLVAEAVAARRDDTVALVMWAPTLEPWAYFYNALLQTVSMQAVLFRSVRITRDQIIENVLAHHPSMVDEYDLNCTDEGFRIGAGLIRDLKDLSPASFTSNLKVPTLLVHVSKRPEPAPPSMIEHAKLLTNAGVRCDLESVVEQTLPWMHEKVFAGESPDLFGKTLQWLGV